MDVEAWWWEVRPRLVSLATVDALTPDEFEARLASLVQPLIPTERIALPETFRRYLEAIGPHTWLSQRIDRDFLLVPAVGILDRLTSALEWEDSDAADAGLWLEIASRGDRHTFFLCCDRDRPENGRVAAGEDTHPWLGGVASIGAADQTLEEWLAGIATSRPRWQSRPLTVLALAHDELEAIRHAEARDPRDVLIEVVRLTETLVPDAAWRHTQTAPERALVTEARALDRLRGRRLLDDPELEAWLTEPADVSALLAALGAQPLQLEAWRTLAWDETKQRLRPVEDGGACITDLVGRAAAADQALLAVREK